MSEFENTKRFAGKSDVYHSVRPRYPSELGEEIRSHFSISMNTTIADLGSGTGIFSKFLLDLDASVIGVEPNSDMRLVAEQDLGQYDRFTSVNGSAECTGLEQDSVDLATAAQAFHWFDAERTVQEIKRISRTEASVALVWNERDTSDTFQAAYDATLRSLIPEYKHVVHTRTSDGDIETLFTEESFIYREWPNIQSFDFDQLRQRMNSSSYVPGENDPARKILDEALFGLFENFQQDGRIEFVYLTKLYLGVLR